MVADMQKIIDELKKLESKLEKDDGYRLAAKRVGFVRRQAEFAHGLLMEIEQGPPKWEIERKRPIMPSRMSLVLTIDLIKKYGIGDTFTGTDVFNYLLGSDDISYVTRGEHRDATLIKDKEVDIRDLRSSIIPNSLNSLVEKGILKTRICYGQAEDRVAKMRHYAFTEAGYELIQNYVKRKGQ